jgi:hypothetical protein
MPEIDVYLKFVSDEDRAKALPELRKLNLPDGEFVEEGDEIKLQTESADEMSALSRAHVIRQGVSDLAGVDPHQIILSTEGGWK